MTQDQTNGNRFPCPCCGEMTLSEIEVYEVCDFCDWEDDPVQRKDPNYEGGANALSLNQCRANWADKQ